MMSGENEFEVTPSMAESQSFQSCLAESEKIEKNEKENENTNKCRRKSEDLLFDSS